MQRIPAEEQSDKSSMKQLAKEALHDLVHFDAKFFRTLPPLLFKPGYLTEKTFSSDQIRFVKPFVLFVFLNFLFFIFKAKGLFNYTLDGYRLFEGLNAYVLRKQAEMHISLDILTDRFNLAMHFEEKEYMIIMVPCFALILQLLYIRQKKNYAVHFIFSLHFYAFFIIYLLLLRYLAISVQWLWNQFGPKIDLMTTEWPLLIMVLISILLYLFIAVRRFYKEKIWPTIIKSLLLSMSVVLIIAFVYKMALFYIVMYSIAE